MRTAATHNLLIGRPDKEVRENISHVLSDGFPVVAFQEASTYLDLVREQAREHGYRAIVPDNKGLGMKSSVLLVKKDLVLLDHGVKTARSLWIGSRRGIHWPGRTIPWAIVQHDGEPVLFACIHGPTGRKAFKPNRISYRLFCRKLRKLYYRKRETFHNLKFFFLGDWNCKPGDEGKVAARHLIVNKLDGVVANPHCQPPIDYAVHNLGNVIAIRGLDYGSDHDSSRYHKSR